jgi:hypothetical protein
MRQQRTIGAIVKVPIDDKYHTYARILDKAGYAFYDLRTDEDIKDLRQIVSSPILFIIAVYDDVITRGKWLKVGKLPLEDELKSLPMEFIQDEIEPEKFFLYNADTGEIIPADKKQCIGLERAAVWEAEHVEDRLRDHFSGKSNKWVESLSIKS